MLFRLQNILSLKVILSNYFAFQYKGCVFASLFLSLYFSILFFKLCYYYSLTC